LYFAWGETSGYTAEQVGDEEGKRAFTWENYEFGPESALTKYNSSDGLTVLESGDDAATENWGSNWKMPTKEQFEELISSANTTTAFTEQNGVSGLLLTSKANNNTLFFPAFGSAMNGGISSVGSYGNFWSVSLYNSKVQAWDLIVQYRGMGMGSGKRFIGMSIRPVRSNN
jgi:hypothetical protein